MPGIIIYEPSGGETWEPQSTHELEWMDFPYDGDAASWGIWLYKNSSIVQTIAMDEYIPPEEDGRQHYDFTVANGIGGSGSVYRIKIKNYDTNHTKYSGYFAIGQGSTVTVTSPNTAVNWYGGTNQNITWTYQGSFANVKIEYVKSSVYTTIVASTSTAAGSYTWAIPQELPPGTNYKIKISNVNDAGTSDISDAYFTILPQTITLSTDFDVAVLTIGTTYNINWTSTGGFSLVHIKLYKNDAPNPYGEVISIGTDNDGSFAWQVPDIPPDDDYSIYIEKRNASSVSDQNMEDFEIRTGIVVTSPNTAVNWYAGSTQEVKWTSSGTVPSIKIKLVQGGTEVSTIANNTGNDGSYNWDIPPGTAPSTNYKVRVYNAADTETYDDSNVNFSILSQSLTVTSPNTNVTWLAGSDHDITWTSAGGFANVRIQLYKNNSLLETIVESTSNSAGSYTWTIPLLTAANDYKIKIVNIAYAITQDYSNTTFAIAYSPPSVKSISDSHSISESLLSILDSGSSDNISKNIILSDILNKYISDVKEITDEEISISSQTVATSESIQDIAFNRDMEIVDAIVNFTSITHALAQIIEISEVLSSFEDSIISVNTSNNLILSDLITHYVSALKELSHTITISENTASLTDSIDSESVPVPISISDTINRSVVLLKSIINTYTISEQIQSQTDSPESINQNHSLILTDVLNKTLYRLNTLSHTFNISDNQILEIENPSENPENQSLELSDTISDFIVSLKSVSNEFNIIDETLSNIISVDQFDINNSIELSETLVKMISVLRSLTDEYSISDNLTSSITSIVNSPIDHSIELSETLVKMVLVLRSLSDEYNISDNFTSSISSIVNSPINNSIELSETLVKMVLVLKSLTDEYNIEDTVISEILSSIERVQASSLEINEFINVSLIFLKTINNTVDIEDEILTQILSLIGTFQNHNAELSDSINVFIIYLEDISSIYNISDNIITTTHVSDSFDRTSNIQLSDILTKYASVWKDINTSFSFLDTIDIGESIEAPVGDIDNLEMSDLVVQLLVNHVVLDSSKVNTSDNVSIVLDSGGSDNIPKEIALKDAIQILLLTKHELLLSLRMDAVVVIDEIFNRKKYIIKKQDQKISPLGGTLKFPWSSAAMNHSNLTVIAEKPTIFYRNATDYLYFEPPTRVNTIMLDYFKAKGNPGNVHLTVNNIPILLLKEGDKCVLPLGGNAKNQGISPKQIQFHVDTYTENVDEALINFRIMGTT